MLIDHDISAVLITGGHSAYQSAEVYHPERYSPCVLPGLPDDRVFHTQDGLLLCGGSYTRKSCRRWNPDMGAWDLVTESLTEDRMYHSSWTPADGSVTYLMGGWKNLETSDVIALNNNVRSSFPLKHRTRDDLGFR